MADKKTLINLTSREFNSIKRDLLNYAKRYYPNTVKDWNEASFGALMVDLVSYVGDVLSFQVDYSANESFLDTSIEYNNVLRHGKSLGYKFNGNPSSYGQGTFYIIVPAKATGLGPDSRYLPVLLKGSEFSSTSGNNFILNENVDFSNSNNQVVVATVNSTTGIPTSYAIRAYGQLISGELFKQTIEVGNYVKFLRLPLSNENIAEVISVVDSEGHEYYEVDYLSQNVVYKAIPNYGLDRNTVNSILKPIIVPRRFVVEQEENITYLQFGYGTTDEIRLSSVVEPSSVVLQMVGKSYITDQSFDPSKLISTDKFGVAPANTVLTVVTRNNSVSNVNAAEGTVSVVNDPLFNFDNITTLDQNAVGDVINSLECTNEEPIIGDVTLPTSEEVKRRIYDVYSSQNRAVTKQDYISCVYQMPKKFGSIKRASISRDDDSFKRNLNLYVLSENSDGSLCVANSTIKNNLKVWLDKVRSVNDTVDILDGRIINVGINFTIISQDEKNKYIALSKSVAMLAEYYKIQKDIGENFLISDVYSVLKLVPEVLDVVDVQIVNLYGGSYNSSYNIDSHLSPDGRLLYAESDICFEVKYTSADIKGIVK